MAQSPYEILGVSENASMDEVKKAYRKKARENHPDLNPNDPQAAERMNKVNEAYDRITNPEKYAREQRVNNASNAGTGSAGNPYGQGGAGNPFGGWGYTGQQGSQQRTQGSQTGGSQGYGWTTTTFTWEDLFGSDWANMGATDPASIHPEANATDSAEVRAAINAINAGQHAQAAKILSNIPSYGRNARWYYLSALANHGAGNTTLGYEQMRKACQMDPHNTDYQRAYRAFQQPGRTYTQQSQAQGFSMNPVCLECCCGFLALQLCLFLALQWCLFPSIMCRHC